MKPLEMLGIILGLLLFSFVVISAILYTNYLFNKTACEQIGRRTHTITVYEFPSGCYKILKGEWTLLHCEPPKAENEGRETPDGRSE